MAIEQEGKRDCLFTMSLNMVDKSLRKIRYFLTIYFI